jgi:hypothetical protein
MKTPCRWGRAAAVTGAALVTLCNVWLIAIYAYPHVETVMLAAAPHGR